MQCFCQSVIVYSIINLAFFIFFQSVWKSLRILPAGEYVEPIKNRIPSQYQQPRNQVRPKGEIPETTTYLWPLYYLKMTPSGVGTPMFSFYSQKRVALSPRRVSARATDSLSTQACAYERPSTPEPSTVLVDQESYKPLLIPLVGSLFKINLLSEKYDGVPSAFERFPSVIAVTRSLLSSAHVKHSASMRKGIFTIWPSHQWQTGSFEISLPVDIRSILSSNQKWWNERIP